MSDLLTPDPTRWAWALALLLAYALLCLVLYQRHRRARLHAQAQAAALASGHRPILIAYASQTGQAQQLAEQCAQPLHAAGWAVTVQALNHTTPAQLQAATHALFIVSTYGEGDAPDNAALFQRQCMAQAFDLSALQYSLLALGDWIRSWLFTGFPWLALGYAQAPPSRRCRPSRRRAISRRRPITRTRAAMIATTTAAATGMMTIITTMTMTITITMMIITVATRTTAITSTSTSIISTILPGRICREITLTGNIIRPIAAIFRTRTTTLRSITIRPMFPAGLALPNINPSIVTRSVRQP